MPYIVQVLCSAARNFMGSNSTGGYVTMHQSHCDAVRHNGFDV